jgi:hypothetical protein
MAPRGYGIFGDRRECSMKLFEQESRIAQRRLLQEASVILKLIANTFVSFHWRLPDLACSCLPFPVNMKFSYET